MGYDFECFFRILTEKLNSERIAFLKKQINYFDTIESFIVTDTIVEIRFTACGTEVDDFSQFFEKQDIYNYYCLMCIGEEREIIKYGDALSMGIHVTFEDSEDIEFLLEESK